MLIAYIHLIGCMGTRKVYVTIKRDKKQAVPTSTSSAMTEAWEETPDKDTSDTSQAKDSISCKDGKTVKKWKVMSLKVLKCMITQVYMKTQ